MVNLSLEVVFLPSLKMFLQIIEGSAFGTMSPSFCGYMITYVELLVRYADRNLLLLISRILGIIKVKTFLLIYRKLEVIILTRADNVLNMQITIVNCMKQEWDIDFWKISDILEKYDLLSYINACYEEYNSMGIKGILQDLKFYMDAIGEDV